MSKNDNSWGSYQHFEKVLRKKQNLQNIAAEVIDLTDDEILSISSQPMWIKKHLIRYRDRCNGYGLLPNEVADEMIRASSAEVGHPTYEAYVYTGDDVLVGKMGFELNQGDHILVINREKSQIKVNHDVETFDITVVDQLLSSSGILGSMTLPEFRSLVSEYLEKKYSTVEKCSLGDSEASDEYSMASIMSRGVRIGR